MKTLAEKIAVMQAFERGEVVETTPRKVGDWFPTRDPVWDWVAYDYRIAEKPKKVKLQQWLCCDGAGAYWITTPMSTSPPRTAIAPYGDPIEVEVDCDE